MTTLRARAPRPQLIHTLALAGLITACTLGPGGSPVPTGAPSGSPNPSGSPSGTPSPTPIPSPSPSPTFNPDQIEHPTGANDIILRMGSGGGHMLFGFDLISAPVFTLYGDGTVIFQPVDNRGAPFGAVPNLPWTIGHMDEEGIQALLLYALDTGRLANAKANYDHPGIADAGTTVFNLNAGGVEKVVTVYALFEASDPTAPDPIDRAGMSQLQTLLTNFEQEADSTLLDAATFEPEFYRVTLLEGFGEPLGEVLEWPWDDLTMADFPSGDEPGGIAILDAEHVAQLMEVPNGGQFGIWIEDPDGTRVQAAVRPLLPDEVEAAGL